MNKNDVVENKYQMDSLDGLRGVAALLVVFSHTSNSGMYFLPLLDLRGIGKTGVFLFFLLSSFLLTLPLLRKGKQIFTFGVMSYYWQRRFFRIYPLYTVYLLLALVSTIVISAVLNRVGVGVPFGLDWAGFIEHLALQDGKGVTWSIAVEFKFYFVLPFFVVAISTVRLWGAWAVLALFLALMVLSQIVSPQADSLTNDVRLLPYLPIFIIGMFLAVVQDHVNTHGSNTFFETLASFGGYVGVAGVSIMTPLVYSLIDGEVANDIFHRQFITYAVLWSLIIFSAVNHRGWLQKILTWRTLRFYGAISFSLYLFHPILVGIFRPLGLHEILAAWGVLLGSTVVAFATYRTIESRFSRYQISRNIIAPITELARRIVRSG